MPVLLNSLNLPFWINFMVMAFPLKGIYFSMKCTFFKNTNCQNFNKKCIWEWGLHCTARFVCPSHVISYLWEHFWPLRNEGASHFWLIQVLHHWLVFFFCPWVPISISGTTDWTLMKLRGNNRSHQCSQSVSDIHWRAQQPGLYHYRSDIKWQTCCWLALRWTPSSSMICLLLDCLTLSVNLVKIENEATGDDSNIFWTFVSSLTTVLSLSLLVSLCPSLYTMCFQFFMIILSMAGGQPCWNTLAEQIGEQHRKGWKKKA